MRLSRGLSIVKTLALSIFLWIILIITLTLSEQVFLMKDILESLV